MEILEEKMTNKSFTVNHIGFNFHKTALFHKLFRNVAKPNRVQITQGELVR